MGSADRFLATDPAEDEVRDADWEATFGPDAAGLWREQADEERAQRETEAHVTRLWNER